MLKDSDKIYTAFMDSNFTQHILYLMELKLCLSF